MSIPGFSGLLADRGLPPLRRARTTTLQVNVGLRCDLACHHCHVEAGPKRREAMGEALAARVLEVLARSPAFDTLDITGGAPELNPHFRTLVRGARALGRRVIDRCNLTVLFRRGQEDTADFLAREGVDVVASLPCYTAENVDAQRGKRVFERSSQALRLLNTLGYAAPGSRLRLDLVYNPLGPTLPPAQPKLEADYRRELGALGLRFDRLLTLTNMPIKRFARDLARRGESEAYLSLLVNHFNPATLEHLMCRSTLSVAWDGTLYDCDFNQALGIGLAAKRSAQRAQGPPPPWRLTGLVPRSEANPSEAEAGERSGDVRLTLFELDDPAALEGLPVATGRHCFGCTAGAGSSCGGALTGIEGG